MNIQNKLPATAAHAFFSIVVSSAIASLAVGLMVESAEAHAPLDQKFECCGLFEGGAVLAAIWLATFCAVYLVTSILRSKCQKKI